MGRLLAGWRALSWRERTRLIACGAGVTLVHVALALFGYGRTRRMVEMVTHRADTRPATAADISNARALAKLANVAGRHGVVDASCLRQSLLLYGWLQWRGLRPVLQLGVKEDPGQLSAHAWVELEGTRLLSIDSGFRSFFSSR
ncbi:lasso peptide biosynthesis B2 protein [Thermomonas sp.]|uniref:lasso peptide biosynthesis B2 protein n=1 Tax=Thermomonas sp. TaxID=1971895 RepID=UPI0024870D03|nr:lasso peptide biosynthesis B2 protein [Thermomonas sp.]MDI1253484.1 lasso peptide biosynthesis B2 protein [Thermomonas sp.]